MRTIYGCPIALKNFPRLFSQKCLLDFCSDGPVHVLAKFEVRIALPVPEIIVIEVWVGVANFQSRKG